MNILIGVNHPAHVHIFKNLIWKMLQSEYTVLVTARNKEVTLDLLEIYDLNYVLISDAQSTPISILKEACFRTRKLLPLIREFKPDLTISQMDPSLAFASKLMGVPYICTADTEHATASIFGALPFTDTVLTPSCFRRRVGSKQIFYNGYKELAYLHPHYFTPDPTVLTELDLSPDDWFIIVRFVSWKASHDVGQHGIRDKIRLVKKLEAYGRVLITSEGEMPEELRPYQVHISPEKMHDLLYYATLYMGEGATMASEAAVLGTPSVFVSSLAGTMGNFTELEETYGLVYSFTDTEAAVGKAIEILQDPASKENWRIKQKRLLREKIDVTAFLIWFIQNYPESVVEMKEHPEVQHRFTSSFDHAS
ncbi:DUF354 domain-containing protein [Methanosphaerula subterraneus]|uniref:DUF354 domain-containing protein n=1 Tax=Methanosphaerula subterraneus TaxID=3350244 RepID=UPI003F83DCBA